MEGVRGSIPLAPTIFIPEFFVFQQVALGFDALKRNSKLSRAEIVFDRRGDVIAGTRPLITFGSSLRRALQGGVVSAAEKTCAWAARSARICGASASAFLPQVISTNSPLDGS